MHSIVFQYTHLDLYTCVVEGFLIGRSKTAPIVVESCLGYITLLFPMSPSTQSCCIKSICNIDCFVQTCSNSNPPISFGAKTRACGVWQFVEYSFIESDIFVKYKDCNRKSKVQCCFYVVFVCHQCLQRAQLSTIDILRQSCHLVKAKIKLIIPVTIHRESYSQLVFCFMGFYSF